MSTKPDLRPFCGPPNVLDIRCGEPDAETFRERLRGELFPGSGVFDEGAVPQCHCYGCEKCLLVENDGTITETISGNPTVPRSPLLEQTINDGGDHECPS